MRDARLIYLPLGGAGEIGMNCYVYGYGPCGGERLILVDLGVTFPNMDGTPGVDLILPDIAWLEGCADRLEAIFITHAHEDHIGALGHLWGKLRVPVYCRRFTANIAHRKLEEAGWDPRIVQEVAPFPQIIQAAGMSVGFMPVTHSIPEASGLVIDTPDGRVVHTGDFKLDRTPVLGEPYCEAAWRAIAAPGIKALICDSTNVFFTHEGRSEAAIRPEIEKLVATTEGMVVATTFASNIARLKTLIEAGIAADRSVCLLGRAMQRMMRAAMETGIADDFPPLVGVEQAVEIPRQHLMLIVSGSQGERRAVSAQLSRGRYLDLTMQEGDLFLFSSKTIPGNEIGVARIINAFSEMGVDVVDGSSDLHHVSGHANRPDLARIHAIMRPQMLIPMHGEHRHLHAHVKLGNERGISGRVVTDGMMVSLSGSEPEVIDHVDTGRVYLDGIRMVGALDGVIRDRIGLAINGLVAVGIAVDENNGIAGDIQVATRGLAAAGRSSAPLAGQIENAVNDALTRLKPSQLAEDAGLEEIVRRAARSACIAEIGKKPEVTVLYCRRRIQPSERGLVG